MTVPRVDRRDFLVGLGALGGAGLAGTLASCHRRPVEELKRLTEPIAETREAEALGVEYLNRSPAEARPADPRAALLTSLPSRGVVDDVIEALHRRILADFDNGDIVRLGGWLFSRTELRLYALEALRLQQTRTPRRAGVFPVERDGRERFRWTGPTASLDLTANRPDVPLRLRAIAPVDQSAVIRIDGLVVGQVALIRGEWRTLRYRIPGPGSRLELAVTPTWRPLNDFRTLGVQWSERAVGSRRARASPREDSLRSPAGATAGRVDA